MRPELRRYLDEHASRYTPQALRQRLLDAGYEAAEVDPALREWEALAADRAAAKGERRRFWWWTLGLHAAVLALLGITSLAVGSFTHLGGVALGILALVLLVGAGISGTIGRGVLLGRGLTVALLVPALSALLIGGTCLAYGGSFLLQPPPPPPPPPRTGVMELRIEPPLAFDGSGTANCQGHSGGTGFSVFGEDLGTLDARQVRVSLESYAQPDVSPAPPLAPGEVTYSLFITLVPRSEGGHPQVDYTHLPTSRVELEASPDGLSGRADFRELEPTVDGEPPGDVPGFEPISGHVSWSCE
jgi:hypothetical protein